MDALHEALSIMSRVIQSFPPECIGSALWQKSMQGAFFPVHGMESVHGWTET
jgi:hypothetical protein